MASLDNQTRAMAAIGMVCSYWADIEFFTTEVIHGITKFLDPAFAKPEVAGVVEVAVTHSDIRDRISIAKVLATQADLGRKLYRRLEKQLNHIDNELRLERNRFVHDEWIVTDQQAVRTCIRPKVVRPQAFQVDMVFATSKTFTIDEVEAFAGELNTARMEMLSICEDIEKRYLERYPPKESPESIPQG